MKCSRVSEEQEAACKCPTSFGKRKPIGGQVITRGTGSSSRHIDILEICQGSKIIERESMIDAYGPIVFSHLFRAFSRQKS